MFYHAVCFGLFPINGAFDLILLVTVGTCCRGGFRSAFLSEGHGTAMRESAVGVSPNPALQYVLCYRLVFI